MIHQIDTTGAMPQKYEWREAYYQQRARADQAEREAQEWKNVADNAVRQMAEARVQFADLQVHSYNGHIVKCAKCRSNLTSLLLCPKCDIRYAIVETQELSHLREELEAARALLARCFCSEDGRCLWCGQVHEHAENCHYILWQMEYGK